MKLTKLHSINFNTEELIVTATLSKRDEIVMLLNSGDVSRYRTGEPNGEFLFGVKTSQQIQYEDGGFDQNAKSTIYTLDEIVVVVNDYKRVGYVHHPKGAYTIRLSRKDYHADMSCFPVGLYNDEEGIPHLIYAAAWNHLQIMNLDTRQILTAAKSLIEENAEEQHRKFYAHYSEDNKLAWPTPYDYFYGRLHVSPDQKRFMSAGWTWGSHDNYRVYSIEQFIESNRIADVRIDGWEHENRAVCWLDNSTVLVAVNPAEDSEEPTTGLPDELHFYSVGAEGAALEKKVSVPGLDLVHTQMAWSKKLDALVAFSEKIGLAVLTLNGELLFQDTSLKIDRFCYETNLLIRAENKTVTVYEIVT